MRHYLIGITKESNRFSFRISAFSQSYAGTEKY